jgi:replicative DNA helicase
MDEIDAIASAGGIARGVPTGFTDLDEVTNGLHPGQVVIIAARPAVGKIDFGVGFFAVVLDSSSDGQRYFFAGDEQVRDRATTRNICGPSAAT